MATKAKAEMKILESFRRKIFLIINYESNIRQKRQPPRNQDFGLWRLKNYLASMSPAMKN